MSGLNGNARPVPDDRYLFRITDDTGMLQHARYAVPDPAEGYTSDDNARALMAAVLLFEATGGPRHLELAAQYLGFLQYARSDAWFRNFLGYDRHFLEQRGSEDCYGRCLWALGFAAGRPGLPAGLRDAAGILLRQVLPGCGELTYPRAKAYALLGLCEAKVPGTPERLKRLASDLAEGYAHHAVPGWRWFEDTVTYCNAVLPLAMLAVGEATGEARYRTIGLESLDFLWGVTSVRDMFRPVGCKGWLSMGQRPAEFDQQPVEACGTLLACRKAFELTGREEYRKRAQCCLRWYTGCNSLGVSLIDPDTGGCMDGLTPDGPNRNEGAESQVSWLIASLAWQKTAAPIAAE